MMYYKTMLFITVLSLVISCSSDNMSILRDIEGRVVDLSQGSPIEEAIVTLLPNGITATTSSYGEFAFHELVEGNYTLTASKGGYQTKSMSFVVEANRTTTANIQLQKNSSSGGGGDAVYNGLWAYYTFDDETMKNAIGNNMNGNFDYTPSFSTSTPSGSGKSLIVGLNSDNQWVKARVPYNPFATLTEYSYCFWVKDPSQGLLMNAYGDSDDNTARNYPTIRLSNNNLYAGFSWSSLNDYFDYNTSTILQDGAWNHIAISVSGNIQVLYINGAKVSTQQSDVDTSESSQIHFGGSLGSYYGAEMSIDNIRLYTRTITQQDAQNIYNYEK